ncbi:flagellar biosynthetic protein FliO [Anaeromyxobacter diazotrophicus]|uniref:Flagellar protein n=1 Tax=Anaeromyxobacter diazotrophicus TaxID=2590199 RepID=A0A7I9VTC4_9BACT|nr:flagellar biosynthetic protein FliO [Anaeromyxobacter diazotrophicus]GEJ59197.1 hypothetical protein AMYX_39380 [Anaeromyxobacter diazotrophicus]
MASTATPTPTAIPTSTSTATATPTSTSPASEAPGQAAGSAEAAGSALTALPGYPATLPSSSFSPGPFAAGLLLAAMAAAAFVMARRRRAVPRLVQVLEQTSLGPKRALVVARLGDELLVLGSSEGGIALLATRPATSTSTSTSTATATSTSTSTANANANGASAAGLARAVPLAGAAVDLLARLKRRAPGRSFDATLAESVEDVELRRKLAQGQRGSVR